jgi:hypothetical protein
MSQIQALESRPGLPMKKGRAGTMTHDDQRNGTTVTESNCGPRVTIKLGARVTGVGAAKKVAIASARSDRSEVALAHLQLARSIPHDPVVRGRD